MSKKLAFRILSKLVEPKGFTVTQCRLVKIKNDLAFVISLECPSGLIYPTVYILPLYVPSQYHYLSYGCRLNYLPNSGVMPLRRDSGPEETEEWIMQVFAVLERFIFPFWDSLSSVSNLRDYFTSHDDISLFQCDRVQKKRLHIYTCIYLQDRDAALHQIDQLLNAAGTVTYFTDSSKAALRSEMISLQTLLQGDPETLDPFIASTVASTMQNCFPKWKSKH